MEKMPVVEKSAFEILADDLDAMQASKNGGRGVQSTKTLIVCLRRGDVEGAKAVARNEGDKILRYPDIRKKLQQDLFAGGSEAETPPGFRSSDDENYE